MEPSRLVAKALASPTQPLWTYPKGQLSQAKSNSPATIKTPTKWEVHIGSVFIWVSGHRDPSCGSLILAWGKGDRPSLSLGSAPASHVALSEYPPALAGLPRGAQTTRPSL